MSEPQTAFIGRDGQPQLTPNERALSQEMDERDRIIMELRASEARLVTACEALIALNDDHSPFRGEMYQDRIERAWDSARAAIAAAKGEK